MRSLIAAILSLGLCATAPAVRAQNGAEARFAATTLNVSAYGEVRPRPDMATLTLGVETSGQTAAGAMGANAEQMNTVIIALRKTGVTEREIRTSELNLTPQYAYEQGHAPRLTGYQASNQVKVVVSDLARLGPVVDSVVAAGATNVGEINFGLTDAAVAEDSARIAAVKALEDKAALYARATGYRVGRLVSLGEGGGYSPGPALPMMAMAAARSVAQTPVSPGVVDVRIDITAVFELIK